MSNELQIIEVEAVKLLPASEQTSLQEAFNGLFDQAKQWKATADSISVTEVTDIEGMAKARETRLKLKDIRVEAEKVRKQLKEDSLLKGRAIDGIYNVLEYLVKPLETKLGEMEKFAEVQEEKRLAALEDSRRSELSAYVVDISPYNLRSMSDEAYAGILADAKLNKARRLEEEVKAEEERKAKIEADRIERERVEKENAALREENAKKQKALDDQKRIADQAAAKAKMAAETKMRVERATADAKLKAEREAKEKLENELAEKKAEEDRIAKEEADKIRKAATAPDKEKAVAFVAMLENLEYPDMQTIEYQDLMNEVRLNLEKVGAAIHFALDNVL